MTVPNSLNTTFSDDLPGTSYEEGGYKRVREVVGVLADAIRSRFGISEGAVIITEYRMFGEMFEPPTHDECDLIITCGEYSKGFADITPEKNLDKLASWAVLPA